MLEKMKVFAVSHQLLVKGTAAAIVAIAVVAVVYALGQEDATFEEENNEDGLAE